MKKRSLVLLVATLLLSGCQEGQPTTSTSYKDVDIVEAFSNTKFYTFKSFENEYSYNEICLSDCYLNSFYQRGYIIPAGDNNYIHEMSSYSSIIDDHTDFDIEVYGRVTTSNNYSAVYQTCFMNILRMYVNTFKKVNNKTYQSKDLNLCGTIADFMQANYLKYVNLVELVIGNTGRISDIILYETNGTDKMLTYHGVFLEETFDEVGALNRWEKNGSIINERILDYKNIIEKDYSYISLYEDEIVKFDAIVVAVDSQNNLYVANKNSITGNVGIKVTGSNKTFEVGTKVNVEGKIYTENFISTVTNATVKDLGSKSDYIPSFDEEMIVDVYGGGKYAADIFSGTPIYSDSLYSTYAYIESLPTLNATKDTVITLSCPMQTNGEIYFKMDLVIPGDLDTNIKNSIYEKLQGAILYPNENANELRFENFILRYNMNCSYNIELRAVNISNVKYKQTISETIESEYGLTDFPLVNDIDTRSFHFGLVNDLYIEDFYELNTHQINGLYIDQTGVNLEQFNTFKESLISLGYTEVDQVMDAYSTRHYLYDYGNVHLDFYISMLSEDSYLLTIFIYKGDRIKPIPIYERVKAKLGDWFTEDYFSLLPNSYDANYTVYSIETFAGTDYSANPLITITYDSHDDRFMEYNRSLIEKGYKQYRVNGTPYSYRCRGKIHYVFYKNDLMVDVAVYHTSDYTYTGHSDFTYRLEIIFYKGTEPLKIDNYDNIDCLINMYKDIDPKLEYFPVLPDDAVVEIWKEKYLPNMVDYGYGMRNEAFIYTSSLDEAYASLKSALEAAGYEIVFEGNKSVLYSQTIGKDFYPVFIMKETEKGYIRLMHDIGGVDFFQ